MKEIVLETERLKLRPLSAKDIEEVYEYNSDSVWKRYQAD